MACSMKRLRSGLQQMQVARADAEKDRDRILTQVPQIEIIRRCRAIDERIGKQIQARGEGFTDTARRDRREIHNLGQRAYAL